MKQRTTAMPRRCTFRGGRPLAAFTLMEVMIAVAALAILAVGIAAVFEMTGRTVSGGRRMSAINAYANLIENQMREDFAAITRDGFMVARHQYANPNTSGIPQDVAVHPDDTSPRRRRADEIVFFIKGQFTSAREPLHPQLKPVGDAARVYYGHGQKGRPAHQPGWNAQFYWKPEIFDLNHDQAARLGANAPGNPNQYAGDWTLLRHATILIPRGDRVTIRDPRHSHPSLYATTLFPNPGVDILFDSPLQVGAQPAAFSIFRRFNEMYTMPQAYVTVRGRYAVSPKFASGLVDIATSSLEDIRAIVMSVNDYPWNTGPNFFNQFRLPSSTTTFQYRYASHGTAVGGLTPERLFVTQAWMDDAIPTADGFNTAVNDRRRIRYESLPPNIVGALSGISGTGTVQGIEAAFRRADQAMLASWGFLPHCSEFIVEWTLGHTFPSDPSMTTYDPARAGQLIWYGLERTSNNLPAAGTNAPLAWPMGIAFPSAPFLASHWRARGAATSLLMHGQEDPALFTPEGPLTSYFGFIDPTYVPAGANQAETRDWPWPTAVRITLSLADPRDPSIEHTFQFVFDIPQQ